MQQFFAIDIGTTHCKALITDETGRVLHTSKAAITPIHGAEGCFEQNAAEIFDIFIHLLKGCIDVPASDKIACISFSAAMHSLLAIDKDGNPLTNAITWADTRSKQYAQQLRGTAQGKEMYKHTGVPIHAMSPLCKLLWLKNEQPEIFKKAAKFISVKEYIFYRLFGKYIIDEGIASATGLYNVYAHTWHQAALTLAGITEEQLSMVVPSTHIETALLPHIKTGLNIPENVPFVAGNNDGCLANLGCGALTSGIAVLTVGTSGAVRLTIPPSKPAELNGLFHYILTDKLHVTGGPVNNGGIALQWFAENFLQLPLQDKNNFETVMHIAAAAPAGADGIVFLPYLLGERAPVWDESATGLFYGLRLAHTKAHLTRAVIEGISFGLLQVFTEMEKKNPGIESIFVSGIVSQSAFWMQLLADMFGKKMILLDAADASAMGAIFMGMYAVGFMKEFSEINKFLTPAEIYHPDLEIHLTYKSNTWSLPTCTLCLHGKACE